MMCEHEVDDVSRPRNAAACAAPCLVGSHSFLPVSVCRPFALLQCIVISFILFYLTAKPPSALATFWGSLLNDDFQLSWFCAE